MQEEKEMNLDMLLELLKGQEHEFIIHVILGEGNADDKERNIST